MGHALFQVRDNRLEFRRRSPDETAVDGAWINRTGLVAEGLASQPYIHMDIRTPFGETVEENQVRDALAESLGPRKDKYRLGGWHIQFVEDTNLGSNHRVFADLIETDNPGQGFEGMDSGLSLELAMEALGDLVAAEKGEQNFQAIYGGERFCYSLLYVNGSPFHVLRVDEGAGAKAAARIRRHREFAPGNRDAASGAGRPGGLRTFLLKDDPLWEAMAAAGLRPEAVLGASAAGAQGQGNAWMLHLGLAQAARHRDYGAHNRVASEDRLRNEGIRTRFRFIVATVLAAVVCGLAALAYGLAIRNAQSELKSLQAKAAAYQAEVDSIRALRKQRTALEASVADLRPLWHDPMDWGAVLGSIAAALPRDAGVDGLSVTREADGGLALSFRAWVRDWNQVQAIQKKLASARRFADVSLSEQRKDMRTGVVVFHVACRLGRE
jgi:Tfp pilus assembly protein PilN